MSVCGHRKESWQLQEWGEPYLTSSLKDHEACREAPGCRVS